ncbi:Putative elongation of fatty acids protein DDB_G0272012 [Linum grandiflorum]
MASPSQILSTLNYWLVSHPQILHYTWSPGETFASTPQFLAAAVISYLILTLLLRRLPFPPLPPPLLKPLTAAHSLILFLLSAVMSAGCLLSIFSSTGGNSIRRAVCFPPGTARSGPLFFWANVFYLSKYLEFGDTLLILLGKSNQRLTFLHVYHHATVVVMCYLWLATAQSLFPVALVTNATVHVVMYYYYFKSAVGSRPRWKRLVTDFQIVQFVFSFGISGLMLYYHFVGGGCSGMAGWCFNAVFNASLLALFVDFHGKSYKQRKAMEKEIASKTQ